VRLVVTIYDLLLASFLDVRGRLASVAYPFPYRKTYRTELPSLCKQFTILLILSEISSLIS
jgi:hypothetical protein